jgi:hypothetical protein
MRKHFKVLALSLLALVGVMAVSASAAQAKWLLLRNGVSVSSINRVVSSAEDFSLLAANGIQIDCTEFSGSSTASLSEENKKLSGSETVTLKGCEEATFGEICGIHSTGQPNGTIVTSNTGRGGDVSAQEVYFLSLSSNEQITTVQFTGAECPLAEIDGTITCHWKETILTALNDVKLHVVHIEETNTKIGGEEVEIDNETGGHVILGSTTEATGATFAYHLVGL